MSQNTENINYDFCLYLIIIHYKGFGSVKRRVVEETSHGDDLPLKRFFRVRVRSSVILEVL